MAGLIRNADVRAQAAIRGLGGAKPAAAVARDPAADTIEQLRREAAQREAALAEMEAETARLKDEIALAFERGKAAGRLNGLQEAEVSRDKALEVLREGVGEALGRVGKALGELDRLALAIASQAMEKMFGDPAARSDLVAAAIRHQLSLLDEVAVLSVKVARSDFPATEELEALAQALGQPRLALSANDGLCSGECQIALRLGVLEVGPRRQWEVLRQALEEMAGPQGGQP